MPALKTRKVATSRFKMTKTRKLIKKGTGHGHFNARESGKKKRQKHRRFSISETAAKTLRLYFQ